MLGEEHLSVGIADAKGRYQEEQVWLEGSG